MATVPIPNPKQKRISARDRWRAKTNYKPKRYTGFAPISLAQIAEIGRLTAGKATQILYVILGASLGQIVKPDEPFNERVADLRTADLAELANCDERTVQRELGDLRHRSLITWEQTKKGVNQVTPLFRSWASLPDYRPGPVEEPEVANEDQLETETDAKSDIRTEVTRKPVYVPAGKRSKAIPVKCGVASLQFESNVDAECSAVVQGGVLLVTLAGKWKPETGVNGLLKTDELKEKPRQGCRILPSETTGEDQVNTRQVHTGGQSSRKTRASQSTGTSPVQHPRAAELSSLFDPFLLRFCGKSLSGDSVALLAACEAIGDVDHDFLVKVVVERAARPINSPRAAVAICKEIAHNWQKGKNLSPESGLAPSRHDVRNEQVMNGLKALNEMRRRKRDVA